LIKSNLLIELEELRKNEEKSRLFEMKRKLGEFKKKRVGVKFNDIWEDGQMILECKEKLVCALIFSLIICYFRRI